MRLSCKEQRFDLHFEKFMVYCLYGALAQLGARHTGSVEATGSSPVCSTFRITGRTPKPVCQEKIKLREKFFT